MISVTLSSGKMHWRRKFSGIRRIAPVCAWLRLLSKRDMPFQVEHITRGRSKPWLAISEGRKVRKIALRPCRARPPRGAILRTLRCFRRGQMRRIMRRQAPGREWREVDVPRRTLEDQLAHRLTGRRRIEHAPDTVAGRHVGTCSTGHGADQ